MGHANIEAGGGRGQGEGGPVLQRPSKEARLAGRWGSGEWTARLLLAGKAVVESTDVISSTVGSPNPAVP